MKEGGLLASLIVLPENDEWWTKLAKSIDYTHTRSISAASSITWVVMTYNLTIIDSFVPGAISNSINSSSQGIGLLWLWLLPIIVGWLQISPNCDAAHLRSAVEHMNLELAHVATDDGNIVPMDKTQAQAIELTLAEVDALRHDELLELEFAVDLHQDERCISPVFNYA